MHVVSLCDGGVGVQAGSMYHVDRLIDGGVMIHAE